MSAHDYDCFILIGNIEHKACQVKREALLISQSSYNCWGSGHPPVLIFLVSGRVMFVRLAIPLPVPLVRAHGGAAF